MERFGNFVFQFCGLKTLAFPARHSLGDGGSLPLSRRSETKTDCHAGLSRRNQMQAEAGRRREPFLSRRSVTKTDLPRRSRTKAGAFASVAEIIGKFSGTDQLRNAVPKLQEPEMS